MALNDSFRWLPVVWSISVFPVCHCIWTPSGQWWWGGVSLLLLMTHMLFTAVHTGRWSRPDVLPGPTHVHPTRYSSPLFSPFSHLDGQIAQNTSCQSKKQFFKIYWSYLSICAFCIGSCDIYSLPEVKGQAPKAGEVPMYVNTQHIDTQVLAALQGESEMLSESGTSGTTKDSPRKDLFDMSKSLEAIHS